MKNTMIDPKELDDLQIAGFPSLVVTDEIMLDLEKGVLFSPLALSILSRGRAATLQRRTSA